MIKYVLLHDSDSRFGNTFVIDKWHNLRGFTWVDPRGAVAVHVGYHYLIYNGYAFSSETYDAEQDGLVVPCRPELAEGAHCFSNDGNIKNDHNKDSIGICLIGPGPTGAFSNPQISAAIKLVGRLKMKYAIPIENIRGHKEEDPTNKSDPRIDMVSFRKSIQGGV